MDCACDDNALISSLLYTSTLNLDDHDVMLSLARIYSILLCSLMSDRTRQCKYPGVAIRR